MPKVDGIEVTRAVKGDERTRHIPIVIMTAWYTADLSRRAESECVSKVLLKPADDHELLDILRAAAEQTRADEAVAAGGAPPERRRTPRGRPHRRK